jgi:disulfide oxidoreductase YuzD
MSNIKEIKRDYNKESFQMEYIYFYEFKTNDSELGKGVIAEEHPEDYLELLTNIFKENLITYLASKK